MHENEPEICITGILNILRESIEKAQETVIMKKERGKRAFFPSKKEDTPDETEFDPCKRHE